MKYFVIDTYVNLTKMAIFCRFHGLEYSNVDNAIKVPFTNHLIFCLFNLLLKLVFQIKTSPHLKVRPTYQFIFHYLNSFEIFLRICLHDMLMGSWSWSLNNLSVASLRRYVLCHQSFKKMVSVLVEAVLHLIDITDIHWGKEKLGIGSFKANSLTKMRLNQSYPEFNKNSSWFSTTLCITCDWVI